MRSKRRLAGESSTLPGAPNIAIARKLELVRFRPPSLFSVRARCKMFSRLSQIFVRFSRSIVPTQPQNYQKATESASKRFRQLVYAFEAKLR